MFRVWSNQSAEEQIITYFSQHTGALGDRTDHAVQVVIVERKQDQGLVKGLVRAPGYLLNLLAVIMASAVRNF